MPSVAQRQQKHENIFLAASDNDRSSVIQFLESGVDVNSLDSNGYSTMHAASSYNHLELLELLVSRGGNVNLQDHDGDTPIFVAENRGMCALLIKLGADVNHRNHEGRTVLEHAREEDDFPDIVAYLQGITGETNNRETGVPRIQAHYELQAHTQDSEANMDQQVASDLDLPGLPEDVKHRITDLMRKTAEDGIDRDDELRTILSDALVGKGVLENSHSKQRTD